MSDMDLSREDLTLLPDYVLSHAGQRTDVPLFYVAGATEGTTQWKAQTLQVVNWGGFEGAVRVPFDPGSTLISGASGSGKSTLLDAYIALMMPSDEAFNGASNDAVRGRARSAGQRNLISYLRGQTDTVPDETGRERPKLLRGDGKPTWGAVATTFVDDHKNLFTALRVYYVPARAVVFGDIITRFATYDGDLDLSQLAPLAQEQFQPKALRLAFPGLQPHAGYSEFASKLYAQLGIGANGDGKKALKLLARIQAGHQIRTVDDLYRDMVLERPATYADADRAISHFDDLDASYQAMQAEQEKADLLAPITRKHEDLTRAEAVIEQIDTFGLTRQDGNVVQLWSRYRELELLQVAVSATQHERRDVKECLAEALESESRLEGDLKSVESEHAAAGGADLSALAAQIAASATLREARLGRRATLAAATDVLALPLNDAATFAQARTDATDFLDTFEARSRELIEEREALRDISHPLMESRRELRQERESLEGRASRIRGPLHRMRLQVAQATGMHVDDLPFLAELIDVLPSEQRWRTAIETVLGASARTLLVPEERLSAFSRAIDPIQLGGRLTFQGVPQHVTAHADPDPDKVAGKLDFKESPFEGWVRRHVSDPARNALCVEQPRDLDGPGYRVTLAGQTRNGSRGTHGRNDASSVIGFSSEEALAEIDAELARIETELTRVETVRGDIDRQRYALDARRKAHEAVMATTWDDIDVAGAEDRIADLRTTRETILNSNDRLQALEARIAKLKADLDAAREHRYGLKTTSNTLDKRWTELTDQEDVATREIDRLERDLHIDITDDQSAALDEFFVQAVGPGDPDDLGKFTENLSRLRKKLTDAFSAAQTAAADAERDLEGIFASYLRRFPDPNLGQSAASYPDYAAILDRIQTTGLHEQKEAWRLKLMQWSGEDLVPLAGAMESCVRDIEERLESINDILQTLPFGATRDQLRIKLRRVRPEAVIDFIRKLREMASGATRDLTDEQLRDRFLNLRTFMARIRRREDPRWDPEHSDRDALLDVRRHVYVTAERYGPDGSVLSVHAALGDKSGGESQELVAFIVGAALRFRLGDDLRARPRFAPVVIDEGFIKSDSEFAGRAVEAWKGLGFQLIVGAPPDKLSALEPHMDAMIMVTKNNTSNYSFVSPVADAKNFIAQVAAAELAARIGTPL